MSDEITFAGKPYVSSKRASKISGYAQDYIGQLARTSQIEAQRIGGLWYVSMDSLLGYRKDPLAPAASPIDSLQSESGTEETPTLSASGDMDSLIAFDGKDYVSASRASKITGYNQDYVGQLARSGQILARQVGNRWYVDREGIISHKQEKDALLAAVQAESVGLKDIATPTPVTSSEKAEVPGESALSAADIAYFPDDGDLLPVMADKHVHTMQDKQVSSEVPREQVHIPIRLIRHAVPQLTGKGERKGQGKPALSNFRRTGALAAAALTVVIVLSFGVISLKSSSTYVLKPLVPSRDLMAAAVGNAFESIAALLETIVSPELVFIRE